MQAISAMPFWTLRVPGIGECYTMRAHFMGKRRRLDVGISAFVIAVCGLRLLLGYLFGGTEDQAGYLRLGDHRQHAISTVPPEFQVGPLCWILLVFGRSLWVGWYTGAWPHAVLGLRTQSNSSLASEVSRRSSWNPSRPRAGSWTPFSTERSGTTPGFPPAARHVVITPCTAFRPIPGFLVIAPFSCSNTRIRRRLRCWRRCAWASRPWARTFGRLCLSHRGLDPATAWLERAVSSRRFSLSRLVSLLYPIYLMTRTRSCRRWLSGIEVPVGLCRHRRAL